MKKLFTSLLMAALLLPAFKAKCQLSISSYPTAIATIYLDFDGEIVNCPMWNNAIILNCAPAVVSKLQLQEIYNRVAEDFRPFNINITTDENVFLAAPLNKRIRVIVTPTSGWFTGAGGVAYIGSFNWGDDTPCFVFSDRMGNSAKMIAECCSHESGHTLGLSHQSTYDGSCNLTATYNDGKGTGEVSWAPIMGNSYYRNMSGWNNGPTPYGCSNVQDNLSILSTQNGFTFKTDDYGDDININPTEINAIGININGLISTSNDKDAFKFTLLQNQNFNLTVKPFSAGDNNEGANLDIKLTIYNENKQLIKIYDPAATMDVTVDTILSAGTYYLVVDGTGNTNVSDYGSLGSYKMTGLSGVLATCNINLTGFNDNSKHRLNWAIQCNESIKSISIETAADAVHFNTIQAINKTATGFTYEPFSRNNLYYRIKTVTASERITYSNIILLRGVEKARTVFTVSTFTQNDISIHAAEVYQYLLSDATGNSILKGNGGMGFNKIDILNKPPGTYVLQLLGQNKAQSVRIIKQ
jgi:hypothetical protein